MLHVNPAFSRIGEENAFAVLAKAAELQRQGRDIINLGIGQPDFSTPVHIVEAAVKALRDGEHGYTAANGILPLREAVAADLARRYRVEVSPDHVLIVPRRQGHDAYGDFDVRRAGRRHPLSRSRLSDLSLDDRIHRHARPVPVPVPEENGFAFSPTKQLALHHAADAAP